MNESESIPDTHSRLPGMSVNEVMKLLLDSHMPVEDRLAALEATEKAGLSPTESVRLVNLLLHDKAGELRAWAVLHAPDVGDDTTTAILWQMIRGERDEEIHRLAVSALAELDGPALFPLLLTQLQDDDPVRRYEAVRLISQMHGPQVLQTIREVFEGHPDPLMRYLAALELVRRGITDGESLLHAYLDDESRMNSMPAVVELSILGRKVALEKLHALLAGSEALEPSERNYLAALLCQRLGFTSYDVGQILEDSGAWVASKLTGGQAGE